MDEAYEWGWISRFTVDGGLYDRSIDPYLEADARAFIEERQYEEDRLYPVGPGDKRPAAHVTYSLRRRPKPVEPEWEEVP